MSPELDQPKITQHPIAPDVVRYIRLDVLNVDSRYQRPLNPTRLSDGGDLDPFRPQGFGCGAVSERADSTLWLLDGQHRTAKGKQTGHGATKFPFLVYTGLTVAEEAAVYRHLNNFKQVMPIDRFRARVIERDPVAVGLLDVLTRYGWRLGGGGRTGSFSAVASLESVYRGMKIRPEGGQLQVCETAIAMLTQAFGHDAHGVKGDIIAGLGLFLLRHRDLADLPKVITELAQLEGGALGLISRAKTLKSLRGGSIPNAMAEILTNLHNRGRRSRLLPEWTRTIGVPAA